MYVDLYVRDGKGQRWLNYVMQFSLFWQPQAQVGQSVIVEL